MVEMTKEMQKSFDEMNDTQKIRMFYELAKYIRDNVGGEHEDPDMENLFDDIANIVNDIESL